MSNCRGRKQTERADARYHGNPVAGSAMPGSNERRYQQAKRAETRDAKQESRRSPACRAPRASAGRARGLPLRHLINARNPRRDTEVVLGKLNHLIRFRIVKAFRV